MKLFRLTALTSVVLTAALFLASCEKEAEEKKVLNYEKKGIILSGAQVAPVVSASTALGSMDVSYSKETKLLTYTIMWSGLTDSVSAIRIHGLAPTGFVAPATTIYPNGIVQQVVASSGGVYAQKTSGKFTYAKSGKITATLLADGVYLRENDILNGMLYVAVSGNNFANPYGEIRGQIVFQ